MPFILRYKIFQSIGICKIDRGFYGIALTVMKLLRRYALRPPICIYRLFDTLSSQMWCSFTFSLCFIMAISGRYILTACDVCMCLRLNLTLEIYVFFFHGPIVFSHNFIIALPFWLLQVNLWLNCNASPRLPMLCFSRMWFMWKLMSFLHTSTNELINLFWFIHAKHLQLTETMTVANQTHLYALKTYMRF